MRRLLFPLLIFSASAPVLPAFVQVGTAPGGRVVPETVMVEHGKATFTVATNMPGLTVKGKSDALRVQALIHRATDGLTFDRIDASLPVKTLATGIALRDEHMREYVFTRPGGEIPDIRFQADNVACPGVVAGQEAICKIAGTLSIRGVPRSFSLLLKIREKNPTPVFRAGGDAQVKLSDYGIEPPSQFGVKTVNDVQIHLEIPETEATVNAAGGR